MLYQWSLLLLATLQYGLTSENFTEIKLCKDKNLTLSLSQIVQLRRAVVTSDPFPVRAKTTCNIRVNFDPAATVNLTLTTVNIWKTLNHSAGAQGYVLENTNGENKFVHSKNIPEGSSAWTNISSKTCPYLFVWRASALNSGDAVQSIFNESTTLSTTGIVIELRSVPETTWCDIRINISVSPIPEDYCQAEDELYCNASVQCLNGSLRCNGHDDCDHGEDEMTCSKVAGGFIGAQMLVSLLLGPFIFILIMTLFAILLRKLLCQRLRRKDNKYDNSNNGHKQASVQKSTKRSNLIENDTYSSDQQRPEALKSSREDPVYFLLESPCNSAAKGHVKCSE